MHICIILTTRALAISHPKVPDFCLGSPWTHTASLCKTQLRSLPGLQRGPSPWQTPQQWRRAGSHWHHPPAMEKTHHRWHWGWLQDAGHFSYPLSVSWKTQWIPHGVGNFKGIPCLKGHCSKPHGERQTMHRAWGDRQEEQPQTDRAGWDPRWDLLPQTPQLISSWTGTYTICT